MRCRDRRDASVLVPGSCRSDWRVDARVGDVIYVPSSDRHKNHNANAIVNCCDTKADAKNA
eukprot:scaffold307223_cov20-Prasinocladus_malaysianus.AAC.1